MKTNEEMRAVMVITEKDWSALRTHLLQADQRERLAFLILGQSDGPPKEYYIHRLLPVPDDQCNHQSPMSVEPQGAALLGAMEEFRQSVGTVFGHVHSHPFACSSVSFSFTDDTTIQEVGGNMKRYLQVRRSDRPTLVLRLVVGQDEIAFEGDVNDGDGGAISQIEVIRVVGAAGIREIHRSGSGSPVFECRGTDHERLDRNVNWLGEKGQAILSRVKVAICGLGGVGAELVKVLRGLGVRKYSLIDPDKVEVSNLNRLPWRAVDVGRFKVDVARDFLLDVDPGLDVALLPMGVEDDRAQAAIALSDVVLCGLDGDGARLHVQRQAARHLRPVIDIGSGIVLKPGTREVADMGGQVMLYAPGEPCLLCQGLDASRIEDPRRREVQRAVGYVQGTNETPASVVTINSVMAALAGDILLRYLTGFGSYPTWIRYDMLLHRTVIMKFKTRTNCPVCGPAGIQGLGCEWGLPLDGGCSLDDILTLPPPQLHVPEAVIAATAEFSDTKGI